MGNPGGSVPHFIFKTIPFQTVAKRDNRSTCAFSSELRPSTAIGGDMHRLPAVSCGPWSAWATAPRLDRSGPRPVGTRKGAAPVARGGALWSALWSWPMVRGLWPGTRKAPIPLWHGRRFGALCGCASPRRASAGLWSLWSRLWRGLLGRRLHLWRRLPEQRWITAGLAPLPLWCSPKSGHGQALWKGYARFFPSVSLCRGLPRLSACSYLLYPMVSKMQSVRCVGNMECKTYTLHA